MKNFGFTLSADRQIDYDTADMRIANYVKQHEVSFNTCIQCGTCAATCTAAQFTDYNPRKMYLTILRGQLAGVEKEIHACMLCGKCQTACPRGVNTRNVLMQIHKAVELLKQNKL